MTQALHNSCSFLEMTGPAQHKVAQLLTGIDLFDKEDFYKQVSKIPKYFDQIKILNKTQKDSLTLLALSPRSFKKIRTQLQKLVLDIHRIKTYQPTDAESPDEILRRLCPEPSLASAYLVQNTIGCAKISSAIKHYGLLGSTEN